MVPIPEVEIKLQWFDTGYEHGNLEQKALAHSDPSLAIAYNSGYKLGAQHRAERHTIRQTFKEPADISDV